MKYPSMNEFIKDNSIQDQMDITQTFDLISSCIDTVYNEDESWSAAECTKKELLEFLDQLSPAQFKEVELFFETMPKISHELVLTNPKTGFENKITLEGLSSFFG
jgi:hypothetical protein